MSGDHMSISALFFSQTPNWHQAILVSWLSFKLSCHTSSLAVISTVSSEGNIGILLWISWLNLTNKQTYLTRADHLFHSFTVLCENENVLISSLHSFFANVTPCPLGLLYSLSEKKLFLSIFSYPFNILNTSI